MSNDLNYKPLIEEKVQEFFKQNPDYTYGELIYSIAASLKKKNINKKSDFLNLSDADFYTGLDLSLKREKGESNEG